MLNTFLLICERPRQKNSKVICTKPEEQNCHEVKVSKNHKHALVYQLKLKLLFLHQSLWHFRIPFASLQEKWIIPKTLDALCLCFYFMKSAVAKQLAHSGCCKNYQEIYSHLHAAMVVYYMEIWFRNTTFTKLLCLYKLQNTKLSHKTPVMRCSFDSRLSKVSTPSEGCAVSPLHLCCALKGQCHLLDALTLATEQHLTCQLCCRSPHRKRDLSPPFL